MAEQAARYRDELWCGVMSNTCARTHTHTHTHTLRFLPAHRGRVWLSRWLGTKMNCDAVSCTHTHTHTHTHPVVSSRTQRESVAEQAARY